jgi:CRISPR-associated endonuclease Csn1
VVSFSGYQIFFVRHDVSTSIVNKAEFSTLNKMERTTDGSMIKDHCIKIKVSRIGTITKQEQ